MKKFFAHLLGFLFTCSLIFGFSNKSQPVLAEGDEESYLLSETYTNEQGPIWFYKYFDKEENEYGELSFVSPYTNTVHWVGDESRDAWKLPESTGKDGYIFAGQTWLPSSRYNISAQFVAPKAGKVNIDCIISRDYPNDWDQEKIIYARIFKNNGANLLSSNDWDELGCLGQIEVDIDELVVQEGDIIYFELNYGSDPDGTGWPRTFFNPKIDYGNGGEHGQDEEPILDSYLLSQTYKDKQGPVWYYKYYDKINSAYKSLAFYKPYTNTVHWVGDREIDCWKVPVAGVDGYIFAGQTWLPALNYNVAAQFKAPKDGYLKITFDASRDFPNDWNSGKNIYLRVVLNDGSNLISSNEWDVLRCGGSISVEIDQLQVTKGDIVSIELDWGDETNGWPRTYLDPLIQYVEKDEEYQNRYQLEKQFAENQGPVWYYKTYNESTETYEELIFDGSVSNTTQRGKTEIKRQWSVESNGNDVIWGGQLIQINDDKIISIIFKAPTTGIVDLAFEITNDVDFDHVQQYETLTKNAYVRISKLVGGKPSTNMIDDEEWSTIYDGYLKYVDLKQIAITANDEIAIEFKKDSSQSKASIYCKPVFKYTEAVAQIDYVESYNYFNTFDTRNKVWKNFYYNKNTEQYKEFDYLGLVLGITRDEYLSYGYKYGITSQDSNYEENQHACAWAGAYICPSVNYDSVIAFVAPKKGTINLNMNSYIYRESNDGVTLKILKVSQSETSTLYPVRILEAAYNDTITINDISVEKGDAIYVQVGANEQLVWDFAYLNPVIGYTYIDPNQQDDDVDDAYTISKARISLAKNQEIALSEFVSVTSGFSLSSGDYVIADSTVANVTNDKIKGIKEGGTTITFTDPASHKITKVMIFVTDPGAYEFTTCAQGAKGIGTENSNWKAMYYTGQAFYALQTDEDGYGYDVDGNPYYGSVYRLNEGLGNVNTTIFHQYYLTPGTINSAVLGYSAEFNGTINIQDYVKGLGNGEEVTIEIRKNDTVIGTHNLSSDPLYLDIKNIQVAKGDMIYFIVSSAHPNQDIRVYLMPTINYTARNIIVTIESDDLIELNVDDYDIIQYTLKGDYEPTMQVRLTIADGTIAEIDENNIIHALKAGETTITIEVVGYSSKQIRLVVHDTMPNGGESDTPKKKGCGGSIVATSTLISVLALAGLGMLFIKKKEKKQ